MKRLLLLAFVLFTVSCGDLKKEVQAGVDFGGSHNLQQCVDESLNRVEACDSFECEALSLGFSRGCAQSANADGQFCRRGPNSMLDVVGWINGECGASRNPKACARILKEPIKICLG